MLIVNWLMEMEPLSEDVVVELLKAHFTVMLVTHAEHARLNSSGLRSTMPADWKIGDNLFARYERVGIEFSVPPASQASHIKSLS